METEQIYIVHANSTEQKQLLKSVFKLHKIKFEVAGESKSAYDKEFTDMVLQADESIRKGQGTTMSSEQFDALWK